MKKEDLRIGNYYYDSVRDKVIKLELKHFTELSISEEMFFKRYKPINIDDAFKIIECNNSYDEIIIYTTLKQYGVTFEHASYNDENINYTAGEGSNFSNDITYLHQLQNCIYGLGYGEIITI